ncbi:MAG: DUF4065 domain-containing protein [Rickettsiales bacterium]|jgi:uncharacterized phage-associated protein|nr:DUF4065 domain-containing protein [Rickettsiales bacterium]
MDTALNVSQYVLSLLDVESGGTLSNLKLQKILYYLQGHFLANFDKPLFNDKIEAWQLGPVIPSVYEKYKDYGKKSMSADNLKFDISNLTEQERVFIKDIFNIYNNFSAGRLVELTHDDEPYKKVFKGIYTNNEMTQESIKDTFVKKIEDKFLDEVREIIKGIDFSNIESLDDYEFSN